ncbi:MAG: flavin reductase family protein [Planctomycetes bacterium]|nr:flavin reductase family protein [Planctomycetota bacterium]
MAKPTKKKALALSQVYRLIEPGPVVLVSTREGGKDNIMAMSWHMMVDFEPPILACVISNRGRTFAMVRKTRELVINIPTVKLARKVVACGNASGRFVDKFRVIGLTPSPAAKVRAPLIAECFANLECKVIDATMAAKYNIFIVEVVKAWIDRSQTHPRTIHHQGRGVFIVDGRTFKLPSRMK